MNELCEMELTGRYEEKLSALKAEISAADEYIRQDNSDLTEFENRYERLDIPYRVKRFLDDYIACMQTKYERLADLVLSGRRTRIIKKILFYLSK